MDRYIVILPHTAEECVRALKQIEAIGAITHFDFGCKDSEHTGFAVIEAESHAHARMVVPSIMREKARVIKLCHFTPEEVRDFHG